MAVPEGMNPENFQKLKEEYLKGLPQKFESLKTSLNQLKQNYDPKDLEAIRFIIHKFAGNAGMFGFDRVTSLCKEWDQRLTEMLKIPGKKPEASFFSELEGFTHQINEEFQHGGK